MVIRYEVPSYLERKFTNMSAEECQTVITGALLSNSDTLLKMELDSRISQDAILRGLAELKEIITTSKLSFSANATTMTSASVSSPAMNDEAIVGDYVPNEGVSLGMNDDDDDDGDFYG